MPDDRIVIPHPRLASFARALLKGAGVPSDTAALVAESLVASNLRGVDSHGVQLLLWYTDQIAARTLNVTSRGHIVSENGSCLIYDGEDGIGQLISAICCDHAIRLAKENGLAMVLARDSSHFGACAYWAQRLAAAGNIGIVMCNTSPVVAPWQGRDRMLGTNPICMAVPGPPTYLLDMATTTVAVNRIHKALLSGDASIPPGWAMDAEGNPTTDPKTAMEGLPMPLGGYKGSGLAVMAEILCAVLSGGAMLNQLGSLRDQDRPMRVSHTFLAIDVTRFIPLNEFAQRMRWLRETIKGSQPAVGFEEVLIAGDPEWRNEEFRRHTGIPLSRAIWDQLEQRAKNLGAPKGSREKGD